MLLTLTQWLAQDIRAFNVFGYITLRTVLAAMTALMHLDGCDGQTYHLTAPETIGLRGIYRGVAAAAGLPPLLAPGIHNFAGAAGAGP